MVICIGTQVTAGDITLIILYVCVHDADGGQSPNLKLPGGCN